MDDLDKIIDIAGLYDEFHVWTGDCINIAIAIQNIFGGKFVAVSSVPEENYLDHVAVCIDDRLYDGTGMIYWSDLEKFVNGSVDDIDNHIHYPEKKYLKSNAMYSEHVKQECENLLSVAQDHQ